MSGQSVYTTKREHEMFADLTHIELNVSVFPPSLLELPVVRGDGQQLPLPVVHELCLLAGDGLGTPPQGQV